MLIVSPLGAAVEGQKMNCVLMLMNVCDINAVDSTGLTPLQRAEKLGNNEMVKLLTGGSVTGQKHEPDDEKK